MSHFAKSITLVGLSPLTNDRIQGGGQFVVTDTPPPIISDIDPFR